MRPDRPQQYPQLETYSADAVTLYLNPELEVNVQDLVALPTLLKGLPGRSTRQQGRVTSWQWRPEWYGGAGLRVRQYAHGGALGKLWGTLFAGDGRMRSELRVALHAYRSAVPTARPVAIRVEKASGPLVRAYYISENLTDTMNLLDLCRAGLAGDLSPTRRHHLAEAIAEAIAAMHQAGILHADLNLQNLLARTGGGEPDVFIIDFDKAELKQTLSDSERMSNLLRLDRSVLKWPASRRLVSISDRLRVLRTYKEKLEVKRKGSQDGVRQRE
ncbi:MAG: phosphotransferase [Planctomycetes bacterium]|nr:phosphotransferase [Planctomycetota bacterium]